MYIGFNDMIRKFNPYHDKSGKFCSKPGAGGGFQAHSFGRSDMKAIVTDQKTLIDQEKKEGRSVGIRIQDNDTDKLGATMSHRSQNFGGDFETDELLSSRSGEALDGVSTIGVDSVGSANSYHGKYAYLVSGDSQGAGYDPGEAIIQNPVVLAKYGVQDGKLKLIEAAKPKTEAPKPEKPKSKQPNTAYSSFMDQMRSKYGDDMWSKMTDDEWDNHDRLDAHKYDDVDKMYSFSNIIQKFNPYNDSKGRFTTSGKAAFFTFKPGSKAGASAIANEKKKHAAEEAKKPKPKGGAAGAAKKPAGAAGKNKQAAGAAGKPKETAAAGAVARRGHVDNPAEYQGGKNIDKVKGDLKAASGKDFTDDEVKAMVTSVRDYSLTDYYDIRKDFVEGKTKTAAYKKAVEMEKFIEASPKWEGGELYRGMKMDNDKAQAFSANLKKGQVMDMKGISSWSSDKKIASSMASPSASTQSFIFILPKTSKGTSIAHLSSFPIEQEVSISALAQFKIKGVKKDKYTTTVTLEEL